MLGLENLDSSLQRWSEEWWSSEILHFFFSLSSPSILIGFTVILLHLQLYISVVIVLMIFNAISKYCQMSFIKTEHGCGNRRVT